MATHPGLYTAAHFRQFSALGCVNARLAAQCREMGLHDRIYVTPAGIDPDRFQPPPFPHLPGTFVAGWAGALHAEPRGHDEKHGKHPVQDGAQVGRVEPGHA